MCGFNNLDVRCLFRSNPCVPAHPQPAPSRDMYGSQAVCNPYLYKDDGVCSRIIRERLVYGSLTIQKDRERSLKKIKEALTVYAKVIFNDHVSARCLQTAKLIYCNHYFQRCDKTSSTIQPVQVCREACDIMVQQHCKEEFRKAHEIDKVKDIWDIDVINCTTLPRRNGGTIPECYYPKELQGICFIEQNCLY